MSEFITAFLNKTKSLCPAKFLDTSNHSILITWLQNRLREHFIALEMQEEQARLLNDYSLVEKVDQFEVMCHELKVLDVEIHHFGDVQQEWDKFMDIMMGVDPSKRPPRSDHETYRVGKSHIRLKYKVTSQIAY
jgi:hypothetical protein